MVLAASPVLNPSVRSSGEGEASAASLAEGVRMRRDLAVYSLGRFKTDKVPHLPLAD